MACTIHATHSYPSDNKQHAAADRQADEAVESAHARDDHATLEHTDELLEEIDSILEENAGAFVRDYVQKPGQ